MFQKGKRLWQSPHRTKAQQQFQDRLVQEYWQRRRQPVLPPDPTPDPQIVRLWANFWAIYTDPDLTAHQRENLELQVDSLARKMTQNQLRVVLQAAPDVIKRKYVTEGSI